VASITITSIPDDVYSELHRRASEAGQSLEEFSLAILVKGAREMTFRDSAAPVSEQTGGELPLAFAAELVRRDRAAR